MRFDPLHLPDAALDFLSERHLAVLTTIRADGSAHVVPVGFTLDDMAVARVITDGGSVKVRHASRSGARGVLCQVDGRRWLTLEGPVRVSQDPAQVEHAVQRYAGRYRVPRVNPTRVVLLITVDGVLGHV